MLSLTRKTDYALVALTSLAQEKSGSANLLSAREIAKMHRLPQPLMMNVLKRLHRSGVVESVRGAKGGYRLAITPARLRLTQVIEAIEGPMRVTACCDRDELDDCTCQVTATCPITGSLRQLNQQIQAFLDQFTLADLMSDRLGHPGSLRIDLLSRPAVSPPLAHHSTQPPKVDALQTS